MQAAAALSGTQGIIRRTPEAHVMEPTSPAEVLSPASPAEGNTGMLPILEDTVEEEANPHSTSVDIGDLYDYKPGRQTYWSEASKAWIERVD